MTKQLKVLIMVLAALIIYTGTVSAYSDEKTVQVIDLDYDEKVTTNAETVGELLDELGITLGEEDEISKKLTAELKNNDVINIERAIPVYIVIDDAPRIVYTNKDTVGELLKDYEKTIGSSFIPENVDESTRISKNLEIKLSTIKEVVLTETTNIPFETETVETDALPKGTKEVKQAGSEGVATITVKNTYKGAELIESEEIGKTVSATPVKEIIHIGTGEVPEVKETKKPETKAASGEIAGYSYKSALNVTATGYTRFDAGCSDYTYTGAFATKGVIAVDPNVIPLGTEVYIPGYGYAVAADIGGAIKGNKIDLCYDTVNEAFSWGRRNVTVYILE